MDIRPSGTPRCRPLPGWMRRGPWHCFESRPAQAKDGEHQPCLHAHRLVDVHVVVVRVVDLLVQHLLDEVSRDEFGQYIQQLVGSDRLPGHLLVGGGDRGHVVVGAARHLEQAMARVGHQKKPMPRVLGYREQAVDCHVQLGKEQLAGGLVHQLPGELAKLQLRSFFSARSTARGETWSRPAMSSNVS
ncbi:hypothetical protein [Variovorax ginsengisoli]|uniref:Uncharacterized protein n=1 Tax=Variovorax ginsengisoli TaxID=363844 RepID=A0ABT8S8M8_9BURK|nr:hypothetical protein [Variovorax ginsengisoli]MDN8616089.1 hypothetical protein [Variovorax ginsengisoli]MDO1535259.1 hypothetical protein [Variovorax ginsengisoli]